MSMPKAQEKIVCLTNHVDADHAKCQEERKSLIGVFMLINKKESLVLQKIEHS